MPRRNLILAKFAVSVLLEGTLILSQHNRQTRRDFCISLQETYTVCCVRLSFTLLCWGRMCWKKKQDPLLLHFTALYPTELLPPLRQEARLELATSGLQGYVIIIIFAVWVFWKLMMGLEPIPPYLPTAFQSATITPHKFLSMTG